MQMSSRDIDEIRSKQGSKFCGDRRCLIGNSSSEGCWGHPVGIFLFFGLNDIE